MSQSKVCPREPTPGMKAAGYAAMVTAGHSHWAARDAWGKAWREMYDVAPDAAPPQADAEALLRELVGAIPDRLLTDAYYGTTEWGQKAKAARAYLAAKDAL